MRSANPWPATTFQQHQLSDKIGKSNPKHLVYGRLGIIYMLSNADFILRLLHLTSMGLYIKASCSSFRPPRCVTNWDIPNFRKRCLQIWQRGSANMWLFMFTLPTAYWYCYILFIPLGPHKVLGCPWSTSMGYGTWSKSVQLLSIHQWPHFGHTPTIHDSLSPWFLWWLPSSPKAFLWQSNSHHPDLKGSQMHPDGKILPGLS